MDDADTLGTDPGRCKHAPPEFIGITRHPRLRDGWQAGQQRGWFGTGDGKGANAVGFELRVDRRRAGDYQFDFAGGQRRHRRGDAFVRDMRQFHPGRCGKQCAREMIVTAGARG